MLNNGELERNCPQTYKNIKSNIRYLNQLLLIAMDNVSNEKMTDEDENALFFASTRYICKLMGMNENNIKVKNAIFTVSTNSTVTRNIELPVLKSKSETMSMIKNELGQLMPVDLNQYKLIYKKTDSTDTDGAEFGKYIVYGLPNSMYEQYIELAERLKLVLLALDLSYNCLDKIAEKKLSINGSNLKSGTASAFIEINYGSITFSVVNSGKNDFSRTYSNGLSDIVKSFGAVFNLSNEEALNEIEKLSFFEKYESISDTAK